MKVINVADLIKIWTDKSLIEDINAKYYNAYDFLDSIDKLDIIDTEPIRHGNWFFIEPGLIACSKCIHEISIDSEFADETKEMIREGKTPNYCPHCGAKMDLKGNTDRKWKYTN